LNDSEICNDIRKHFGFSPDKSETKKKEDRLTELRKKYFY